MNTRHTHLAILEDNELTMADLHFQTARELCELASICKDVENALGVMLEFPGKPMDRPIITLQGLDRLRQSLEDMARLSEFLAQTPKGTEQRTISVAAIRENIVLEGLADRLTGAVEPNNADMGVNQDEIWC